MTDEATLSGFAKEPGSNGASNGGDADWPSINATDGAFVGTIGFTLKGPDQPTATPPVCSATNATAFSGESQTFPINATVTGNTTYGPVSFKPGAPGPYHWVAVLSRTTGTSVNNSGLPVTHNANCSDGDENVVVRQIPTELRTKQSWFPNDSAQIKSSIAGDNIQAGGTVDFFLYDNATCSGTLRYNERITLAAGDISGGIATVGTKNYPGGNGTGVPSNPAWAAYRIDTNLTDPAATTVNYSWKVVYSPAGSDTAHVGRQSACSTSPVSIEKFSITYTNDNSGGTAP